MRMGFVFWAVAGSGTKNAEVLGNAESARS
jgi:hypothetical protein